ncbi:hypothetical protein, partial [Anaeromyxobacter sp. SG26]
AAPPPHGQLPPRDPRVVPALFGAPDPADAPRLGARGSAARELPAANDGPEDGDGDGDGDDVPF